MKRLLACAGDISSAVKVDGQTVKLDSIRNSLRAGIAYVAEDRADKGVFLDAPIAINITASVMAKFTRAGIMREQPVDRKRHDAWPRCSPSTRGVFRTKCRRLAAATSRRSLAKAVAPAPRLLLLNEPTRGVDIGARSGNLRHAAQDGGRRPGDSSSIRSDLEEIPELADTVLTCQPPPPPPPPPPFLEAGWSVISRASR